MEKAKMHPLQSNIGFLDTGVSLTKFFIDTTKVMMKAETKNPKLLEKGLILIEKQVQESLNNVLVGTSLTVFHNPITKEN